MPTFLPEFGLSGDNLTSIITGLGAPLVTAVTAFGLMATRKRDGSPPPAAGVPVTPPDLADLGDVYDLLADDDPDAAVEMAQRRNPTDIIPSLVVAINRLRKEVQFWRDRAIVHWAREHPDDPMPEYEEEEEQP